MAQEEKELLLKDLCSRVLYRPKGVFLHKLYDPEEVEVIGYSGKWVEVYRKGDFDEIPIELVRLYLRPMSSMTDKEKGWYDRLRSSTIAYAALIDWLNEHHFDYRGLIEKGLALEAPEGMYNV